MKLGTRQTISPTLLAIVGITATASIAQEQGKGSIELVNNGQPKAIIVMAENPTRPAHVAAKEFIYYVKKVTGVELPLYVDGAAPKQSWAPRRVLIGESTETRALGLKNSDFQEQEYLIETRGGNLIIMGRDAEEYGVISYEDNGLWPTAGKGRKSPLFTPMGSLYAVDTFLEKYCGVRWYLPGGIGEVCPKRERLLFTNIHVRTKPWTRYRWSSRLSEPDPFEFYEGQPDYKGKPVPPREMNLHLLRMKIGGTPYVVNHSFYGYYNRFAKEHPNWWADGKPQPHNHLDYLNPAVIAQAAQDAIDYFDGKFSDGKYPDGSPVVAAGNFFAVMPLDRSTGWVMTDKAKALLHEPGPGDPKAPDAGFFCGWASEYVFTVVNEAAKIVAKKHPNKWITASAYASYYLAPEKVKLSPNISLCVTGNVNTSFHPEDRRYYEENLRSWGAKVKDLTVWEYYQKEAFNQFNYFPVIFPRRVAAGMKFMQECGVKGVFFEDSGSPGLVANPAAQMLRRYITWKYACDTSRPIDEIVAEFHRLFFGPAEKPMCQFFDLIEQRWNDPKFWQEPAGGQRLSWELLCPPEVLKQLEAPMRQAMQMDLADPYNKRVELIYKAIYEPMERNANEYQARLAARKRINCRVATSPPKIDGKLDDPAWATAAVTGKFVSPNNVQGEVSTTARIARDNENLYLGFSCQEPAMDKLVAAHTKPDDLGIAGDCDVELFLDVDRTRLKYYHLLVNTLGNYADRGVGMDYNNYGLEWNSGMQLAVNKQADGYSVEIAIPLKSLGVESIKPGEVWGINFGRCRGHLGIQQREPRFTCWSPTFSGFNNPDEFGVLTFTEEP